MRILSWNVNGLRSVHKKALFVPFIEQTKPDILCLQETKAEQGQAVIDLPQYEEYWSSSKLRKGYSGVAVYTKSKPTKVELGIGIPKFDDEGRIIVAEYSDFVLLNVYFPNGGQGPHRLQYKLEFYDAFLAYVDDLRKKGRKVIFCGDVNTAHEEIDLARPKQNEENTGFLPEERAWVDEVVRHGYIDTFRHFYPTKTGAYSYWDYFTAARERNVGWRIDYFFISPDLLPRLTSAFILDTVYGSDHCPVGIELS